MILLLVSAVLHSEITMQNIADARKIILDKNSSAEAKTVSMIVLKQGADENLREAVYWYAWMRFYGKGGLSADKKESFKYFMKSAQQGHPRGLYWVGYLYATGEGTAKNAELARSFMQKAADTNNVEQMRSFAYNCLSGRYFQKDEKKAVLYYQKCADKGDAHSMYQLGYCYAHGRGVKRDAATAFKYYCMAAEKGDKDAQFRAAMMSFFRNGTKRDDDLSFRYLSKAAAQGHVKAIYRLGNCYYFGFGVKQDFAKALEFFHKAAEKGETESMVAIGYCYFRGFGVNPDWKEAVKWYKKAAEKKNISAYLQLARMYFQGTGLEKDFEKSFHYYMLISKSRDHQLKRISASEIAEFYEKGIVVAKDLKEAFRYYDYAWSSKGRIKTGIALLNGIGTEKSAVKALKKFRDSVRIDKSPLGAYYAAVILLSGAENIAPDNKQSVKFLQFAAGKKYIPAMRKLAEIYRNGIEGISVDAKAAAELEVAILKTPILPDEYFYGSAHL